MKKYNLTINGNAYSVVIEDATDNQLTAEVNGVSHTINIESIENLALLALEAKPPSERLPEPTRPSKRFSSKSAPVAGGEGAITTPIPGQIMSIHVSKGDKVRKGQKLIILEAMKLENIISATSDGTVQDILVKEGEVVNQDQALIIVN